MLAHAVETLSGLALWAGIAGGVVSLWLIPIALSLSLAVPLSAVSGLPLRRRAAAWMATREVIAEPAVARAAHSARHALQAYLAARGPAE